MTKNSETGLYEVEVDGEKYEFAKWGAEDATDTLLDLISIVGQPLGMATAAFFGKDEEGNSGMEKAVDPNVVGSIMEALTTNVGKNKAVVKALVKKFCSDKVFCNGAKIVFNEHYKDRTGHMLKVVKAGLEVQFGSFFEESLGKSGLKVGSIINRELRT